jgi:subtilisin family serine protease
MKSLALVCLIGLIAISGYSMQYDDAIASSSRIPNPVSAKKVKSDTALSLIGGEAFLMAGYTGKGVKIGIIDVGFYGAKKAPFLKDVFKSGRVKATKDFVDPADKNMYDKDTELDWHGTGVFKYVAGVDEKTKMAYGVAPSAEFYLARTDHGDKEFKGEMENFERALEWLHQNGVKLVQSSLGYAYGFDRPEENFVPADMNGKTSAIARIAEKAVKEYGMVIVVAAGNDGDNPWKIISTPADAESVIAVGATDSRLRKNDSSSEGPEFLPYLKPEISCFASQGGGTSFAAPVITGMIACMLERNPDLTPAEIKDILKKSGHLYPYGNNYVGFGTPDAAKILTLLGDRNSPLPPSKELKAVNGTVRIALKSTSPITLYHKMNPWIVLSQENLSDQHELLISQPQPVTRSILVVDDKLKSKYHVAERVEQVKYTTVVCGSEVFEVVW